MPNISSSFTEGDRKEDRSVLWPYSCFNTWCICIFLKQSWRGFTEFGVALVRIKLCIHAREKIAFYCGKLCKSNQGSAHVLLLDERLLSIEARECQGVT